MGIKDAIRAKIQAQIRELGGPAFEPLERKLAELTGRPSDGVIDQADIDKLVDLADVSWSGSVKKEMMKRIDGNGNKKITAAEWALRPDDDT
jgi:hypothetical protein